MTDLTSPEWSRQTEMVVSNFDYTGVVTNESWKHWTDASTSDRFGRIGYDFIQSINGSEWNIFQGSRTKAQDRTSGAAWKPKIHAKPGETGVESRQRWL